MTKRYFIGIDLGAAPNDWSSFILASIDDDGVTWVLDEHQHRATLEEQQQQVKDLIAKFDIDYKGAQAAWDRLIAKQPEPP